MAIHRQMLLDLAKLCQFSHLSAANWYYYRHKKKVLHLVIILGYREGEIGSNFHIIVLLLF